MVWASNVHWLSQECHEREMKQIFVFKKASRLQLSWSRAVLMTLSELSQLLRGFGTHQGVLLALDNQIQFSTTGAAHRSYLQFATIIDPTFTFVPPPTYSDSSKNEWKWLLVIQFRGFSIFMTSLTL